MKEPEGWSGSLSLLRSSPLDLAVLTSPIRYAGNVSYLLLSNAAATKYLGDGRMLNWARWNKDGHITGTITGHYEWRSWYVLFEVDVTTTFLLVPASKLRNLLLLLLPESLQYLCRWDAAARLVYCQCSVQ